MDQLRTSDLTDEHRLARSGARAGRRLVRVGSVVGIAALVVILVFILQNLQSVEVYFLVFHGHLPLAVALLFAMVLGAVVVLAFGGGRILQLRLVARRARRQESQATPPE